MKKLILSLAVIFIAAVSVNAQKTTFGVAANVGVPTTTGYSVVFGADLQADIPASQGLKITVSAGYENYSVKTSFGGGHYSFIPALAGAKFDFSSKFYGHAQLGYGFSTTSGGGGAFAYAPSIGYKLSPKADLSIKYLGLSKNSFTLGALFARLAYNF